MALADHTSAQPEDVFKIKIKSVLDIDGQAQAGRFVHRLGIPVGEPKATV